MIYILLVVKISTALLLLSTVAHKCHGKIKRNDKAKTTATQNSHSKIKNLRQNKIATAKLKNHRKLKKLRQNEKAAAK